MAEPKDSIKVWVIYDDNGRRPFTIKADSEEEDILAYAS
jgi:hypothetical protein